MKINITKKQYVTLAKAVYLGNWMANAQRTGQKYDPQYEEYNDIADYVYSFAKDFGFSDDFEAGLEFSDSEEEPPETSRLHEEYDEQNFWEVLPDMLGRRDFFRRYSKEEMMEMTQEEYFIKLQECIIAWEEECENYGVERLEIQSIPIQE